LTLCGKPCPFAQGRFPDDLDDNRQLVPALVNEIEIVGEAATQLTEETRRPFPETPWVRIAELRNRLVHAYFDVIPDIFGIHCTRIYPSQLT
jgi:uncharacterized protein with HEPN domain